MATLDPTTALAGRERARLRAPTLLPATRPPGPVTLAIRAVREAHGAEDLRRRLEERIEADLALLDALDGDPDLEDGCDVEVGTDDNGMADGAGAWEQGFGGYGQYGFSGWTGGL